VEVVEMEMRGASDWLVEEVDRWTDG